MKKFLFVLFVAAGSGLLNPRNAKASTDVNEVISSATIAGVQCSTSAAGQIDNAYSDGASTRTAVMSNRVKVCVQNQGVTTLDDIWLGFTASISSQAGKAQEGWRVQASTAAGNINERCYAANRDLPIYCLGAAGGGVNGGVRVAVEQYGKP